MEIVHFKDIQNDTGTLFRLTDTEKNRPYSHTLFRIVECFYDNPENTHGFLIEDESLVYPLCYLPDDAEVNVVGSLNNGQ